METQKNKQNKTNNQKKAHTKQNKNNEKKRERKWDKKAKIFPPNSPNFSKWFFTCSFLHVYLLDAIFFLKAIVFFELFKQFLFLSF